MFRYQGTYIINEHGCVVSPHNKIDQENRQLVCKTKTGGIHEQWDIVYADQWPEEPKDGELNKDFGLLVNRPFYVVSKLPRGRFLDMR